MNTFSYLRSRRSANKNSEVAEQMISFRLGQEFFALPIEHVQKVTFLEEVYGDPQQTGISLTRYQNQEILVIDVAKKILKPRQDVSEQQQRFLVVIKKATKELVGLPIDSPPSIIRVTQSAMTTISETYLTRGSVRSIGSQMIQLPNLQPIFLLDIQKLLS